MTRRSLSVLVLVLAVAGCGGSSDPKGPTATVGSPKTTERTTTTTAKPATPEAEVEAAYLESWDVYAKAMRTLDPSGLEGSYAGDQLGRTTADVTSHKSRGVAVKVDVEHDYVIEVVATDLAVVRDRYRNHSVLVDPNTGSPKEPDPNKVLFETYTLKELSGRWKVIDIVRESP